MKLESLRLDGPFEGLELAYVDWGQPNATRVAVCAHGLTRNSRDFDILAQELVCRDMRVLAVDVVGRGRSSWLPDPKDYTVPNYIAHLARFLELLELKDVNWIGTSMGGIIGMGLAAAGEQSPIARLVLNDIGPFMPREALLQIQTYLGVDLVFPDLNAVEQHLRTVHSGFGQLEEGHWRRLAEHGYRSRPDGLRLHYDPAIRIPYVDLTAADIDLWQVWDNITCPTLVLRGAESMLLTEQTAAEMQKRGPKARLVLIPNAGHAPALMDPAQVKIVASWLDE